MSTAAERAFRQHRAALLRYVYRLTGDAEEAEDVAQETFLRLLESDAPAEKTWGWFCTVATNLVRDRNSKRKRRRRLLSRFYRRSLPRRPDKVMEHREALTQLREALYGLPTRDRALLLLRAEGFRYREIAEILEIAPNSVGPLVGRALRKLRRGLAGGGADGRGES